MGSAKKGASNPFFKSKYADLNSVLEAVKEALNSNGITILQPHFSNERGDFVSTVLLHESGEWISSETRLEVAKKNDPQALGSSITYARRYGLQSLVGLPAEDDDGNANYEKPATKGTMVALPTKVAVETIPTTETKTSFKKAPVKTETSTDDGGWQ